MQQKPHVQIPLPRDIYGSQRPNSKGREFADVNDMVPFIKAIEAENDTRFDKEKWS